MAAWSPFPFDARLYQMDRNLLTARWAALHAGDAVPWPGAPAVQSAWSLFHSGHFEEAWRAGHAAGGEGIAVANKAQALYAQYLAPTEQQRLDMLTEVAERADARAVEQPDDAQAWFWLAYSLGRYSQNISVTRALDLGLGEKIHYALTRTLQLQPRHADAHTALGTFHAELVDKLGLHHARELGTDPDRARNHFERALLLHPRGISARVEFALGLNMLADGAPHWHDKATQLLHQAVAIVPLDAKERLDVARARAELSDG
jgi:tetratricopeptide (TPR) repeat protein